MPASSPWTSDAPGPRRSGSGTAVSPVSTTTWTGTPRRPWSISTGPPSPPASTTPTATRPRSAWDWSTWGWASSTGSTPPSMPWPPTPRDWSPRSGSSASGSATDVVKDHVGPSSIEELAAAIDRATSQYLAEGITSFTDAGIGCPGIDHSPVELAAYQLARETGRLRARAHLMAHDQLFHPLAGHRDDRIVSGLDLGARTGFGDPWLSLGAMKVWVDGSGLGGTAATTGPGSEIEGEFDNDPAVLRRSIIDAHRAGSLSN